MSEVATEQAIEKPIVMEQILAFENVLKNFPETKFGDEAAPLIHTFTDGVYCRQIFMQKGMVFTSKIHKTTHPYFVMTGDVSVLTEDGVVGIKAPYFGVTQAGTKRVLYIHEDTVWITVHATKETDLQKIEDEIIAKTFDELPENLQHRLKEREG